MIGRNRAEREIESLERDYENTDDPNERSEISQMIRDIEREEGERERWQEEGHERGWQ